MLLDPLFEPQSKLTVTYPSFSLLAPGCVGKEKQSVVLQKGTNLAGRTQKIILIHLVVTLFRNCLSQNDSHLSRTGKAWISRPPLHPFSEFKVD